MMSKDERQWGLIFLWARFVPQHCLWTAWLDSGPKGGAMTTPMGGVQKVEDTNSRSGGEGRKRDSKEWSEIHSGLRQMLRGLCELWMILGFYAKAEWDFIRDNSRWYI